LGLLGGDAFDRFQQSDLPPVKKVQHTAISVSLVCSPCRRCCSDDIDVPDTDDKRAKQWDDVVNLVLGCPAVDEQSDRDEGAAVHQRRQSIFRFGLTSVPRHEVFQDFVRAISESREANKVAYTDAEERESD
jgi:hypothetical protein